MSEPVLYPPIHPPIHPSASPPSLQLSIRHPLLIGQGTQLRCSVWNSQFTWGHRQ